MSTDSISPLLRLQAQQIQPTSLYSVLRIGTLSNLALSRLGERTLHTRGKCQTKS